jgi:uncharacterized membrane protein
MGGAHKMREKSNDAAQFERVVFFSDAVFAIAITLLVIEIHVPDIAVRTDAALGQALLELLPKYIGFIVSFFVIGRFWIGHHRLCGHLAKADDGFISRNLLFLMLIAFGPFPTALLSEYPDFRMAIGVYAGWLILAGLTNHHLCAYAAKQNALWVAGEKPNTFSWMLKLSWLPVVIGISALAFGLLKPILAMIPLVGAPMIMWSFKKWIVDR